MTVLNEYAACWVGFAISHWSIGVLCVAHVGVFGLPMCYRFVFNAKVARGW